MKKNFLGAMALVFVLQLFMACNQSAPPPLVRKKNWDEKEKGLAPSKIISPAEAMAMRQYYRKSKEHLKTIYLNSNGVPVIDTLQGFVFEVSDFESLIKDANGKKAKSIIIYFGRDANNINDGSRSHPSYALITMAIDSLNKLGQVAYDKADPCPPNCPK